MLFSELYKIIVSKITFAGFEEAIAPLDSPLTVRVIYSGVFKGRQEGHLPRPPPFFKKPPSRYIARKNSSFLVKKLLSAHIIFSKPHHNSVLCLQRGPQVQLQCASRLMANLLPKGPPKTIGMCRYSALQGSPIATSLCKYSTFKGTPNSSCNM